MISSSLHSNGSKWSLRTMILYLTILVFLGVSEGQHGGINRDGVRPLTTFEKRLDQLRMNSLFTNDHTHTDRRLLVPSCEELCKQCIEIDVYFHLSGYPVDSKNESSAWMIPHPTHEFRRYQDQVRNRTGDMTVYPEVEPGRFSSPKDIYNLIEANLQLMNELYADTPFRFRWVNNDPETATVGVQRNYVFFFVGNVYRSNDYAKAMHTGDVRTLNVYLVYRICGHPYIWVDSNCQTIGGATNPSYQLDGTTDGVYVTYDTLTGGGLEYYSNGLSLVHEVGHWLGLLHVFQNESLAAGESEKELDPCDPINEINGDFVDDTPFIPQASVYMYRCSLTYYEAEGEEIPDSCPNLPGVDPVFNIMNYVNDENCMNDGHAQFTCGQVERMYKQWLLYRAQNSKCATNEMMLNLTMKLDLDSFENMHAEISTLGSAKPVFDFSRDLDLSLFPSLVVNDTRILVFCVPEGDYVLAVTDLGRDGFQDGYVDLSVNDNHVHRVEGNFGSTECVKFNANGAAADRRAESAEPYYFGEPYHFDIQNQNISVSCFALNETYYREPVPITEGRFMKVNVSLDQASVGVCINDVSEVSFQVDSGDELITAYPSPESVPKIYRSRIESCRGPSCVVSFDTMRLAGMRGSRHVHGIYNTTCIATVKLGFGQACDDFLKRHKIDCSMQNQHEVVSTARGNVLYSLPNSSAKASQLGLSLLIFPVAALLTMY